MYKFYVIFAVVAAFAQADDEPFSIGLGVLSPSYSQTVGKENVKVNFEQKDNGFSYSVGDPLSGTNTYLNFGSAATGHLSNPAGFADANPAGYSGPAAPSGYAAPQANPSYQGYSGYQAPSYAAGSGAGLAGYGAGASPNSYVGESARKPEEGPSQILPAGFSYHGTDGQAFLRQDSPNFVIGEEQQESPRGLAEQSFHSNLRAGGNQGKFLVNGLVGYGAGGPRGGLPVGGYAGPQFAGLVREHGGHSN